MSRTLTIEREFHFERRERGRREVEQGPAPAVTPPRRVPRIARLMALAIRLERLLQEGVVSDYRALAELSHVSRARISQIVNLVNLAPEIQEALLFLPRIEQGRDDIYLRDLQPIASTLEWRKQRVLWKQLLAKVQNA
jgi:hypothetical protein